MLDLAFNRSGGICQEGPESLVEAEVAVGLAHEIQYGQAFLSLMKPEPAACVVLVSASLYVFLNLGADVLYFLANPRLRETT